MSIHDIGWRKQTTLGTAVAMPAPGTMRWMDDLMALPRCQDCGAQAIIMWRIQYPGEAARHICIDCRPVTFAISPTPTGGPPRPEEDAPPIDRTLSLACEECGLSIGHWSPCSRLKG